MPRRKVKPEKVVEEKIRENLDAIIMEESLDSVSINSDDLPRLKTSELMNFAEEKMTALSEAKSLMDSVAKFYVDPDAHGHLDLLDFKKKIDATNISAMMFQMKSAQHAITKLLEEIDLGNMHPRIFEVLAQLQSQIMQMPKDYQAYLEKMEQNYKKVNTELEDKKHSGGIRMSAEDDGQGGSFFPPSTSEGSGIKSRGTRGIMEGLREVLGSEIIDVKPLEVNPNAIVNARDKKIIDDMNRPSNSDDEDMDGFIIEDDIIE
jgi:hypothetical protein